MFTASADSASGATSVAVTPLLEDDESLVATFPGTMLRIRGGQGSIFDSGAGGYPGKDQRNVFFVPWIKKGTLFITTKRIVFLRRAIDWKTGYLAYKRGVVEKYNPAGGPPKVLGCAGLEFCEILASDVRSRKQGLVGGTITLESHGRVYRLRLSRRQFVAVQAAFGNKAAKRIS